MKIVEVDGLHKSLPNVKHEVINTKGEDKLLVLKNVISQNSGSVLFFLKRHIY
jgi:hypothetical protein